MAGKSDAVVQVHYRGQNWDMSEFPAIPCFCLAGIKRIIDSPNIKDGSQWAVYWSRERRYRQTVPEDAPASEQRMTAESLLRFLHSKRTREYLGLSRSAPYDENDAGIDLMPLG
jgi:hypothetical protein